MSVIGIDFGNESCFVAVAKAGGIETIANDYSLRATPSCVAFTEKNRILGVAAKNQQVTNMKNTICNFKRLLGRKFNDPHTQNELLMSPNNIEQLPNGGVGFRVNYLGQEHVFSPEQLTAMLFTKLKDTSASALQTQINDCVITVPFYFTNAERKALLDAAQIAGLNVLRLMNETTATALSYGFYRTDLPAENEKARNVIFVDCGHSCIQVSACAFNKSKLKMLAASSEQLGGRDFDYYLAEHFSNEFVTKYKIDPRTNKRAWVRLLAEVEKLKKQMSANNTKLPLGIECFMNDIDVSSTMQRGDFEQMCAGLFKRVEETFKKCLKDSKLSLDDIHSVEVVGGSSRIPAIKQLIEQIFGKPASTTLNQDEAVSRGAALQCAIMSPAVRVREFGVTDIQNYPVKISWDGEGGHGHGEMEVFPAYHAAPFSRLLSLYRREPFNVQISYADPKTLPYPDTYIGHWSIKGVKPNVDNESQEVKIKVRINHNGIVLISSAQMVEKKDTTEQDGEQKASSETIQTEGQNQEGPHSNTGQEPQSPEPMEVQQEDLQQKDKKKKSTTKLVELALDAQTHGYPQTELNKYVEEENRMINNDRQEKERVDARNALEEFVYDMRGRIQESGELYEYVLEEQRESICKELDVIESWLYEEGEDCERQIYKDRLQSLHKETDPIKNRQQEFTQYPGAFEKLGHAIQMARKAVDQYRSGDEKYNHLTETEILNISETADKAEKFFMDAKAKLSNTPRTSDPTVHVADVYHECDTLTTCVRSVLSRPKPKAPTPPPVENNQEQGDKTKQQNGENPEMSNNNKSNNQNAEESKMDVE
uniref:CSON011762 protein n=1 Tax=Culicoides sonorensis TaxID=179676 RepID=A0A336MFX0_CULSO